MLLNGYVILAKVVSMKHEPNPITKRNTLLSKKGTPVN